MVALVTAFDALLGKRLMTGKWYYSSPSQTGRVGALDGVARGRPVWLGHMPAFWLGLHRWMAGGGGVFCPFFSFFFGGEKLPKCHFPSFFFFFLWQKNQLRFG